MMSKGGDVKLLNGGLNMEAGSSWAVTKKLPSQRHVSDPQDMACDCPELPEDS